MAVIKVYSPLGVKEIKCFDTLENVPFLEEEEPIQDTPEDKNPFE